MAQYVCKFGGRKYGQFVQSGELLEDAVRHCPRNLLQLGELERRGSALYGGVSFLWTDGFSYSLLACSLSDFPSGV